MTSIIFIASINAISKIDDMQYVVNNDSKNKKVIDFSYHNSSSFMAKVYNFDIKCSEWLSNSSEWPVIVLYT